MAALTSSGGAIVGGGEVMDVDEPRLVHALKTGNLKAVDDILAGSVSLTINSLLGNQSAPLSPSSTAPSPPASQECTPLYLVCAEDADNAEEIVCALLAKGADVNKPSLALGAASTDAAGGGGKKLPLDAATHNRNLELSLLLLDSRSKMTAKSAGRLRKLKQLSLAGRGLTTVPAWLEEFKGLRQLDLSDNKLTTLPPFLANIKGLVKLDISGNPLESIPSEVKGGSLKGILVYLRQLAKSQAKWARIKLMLVGKENVGKTTLLHCLTTLLHNPKAAKKSASDFFAATAKGKKVPSHLRHLPLSTDGIGMGELSTSAWVAARRKGKTEPVTFQTYDFGGQMVFYPTHQLFLTARSIYLVVFNVVEDDRNHVLYWLKQVRASTKGNETPIIVVGTHIDHPDCPNAQALTTIGKQLQREERWVRKVCYISCKSGDGLEELMESIIDLANQHSFLKQFIPGSYYTLHQTITNLRTGKVQVDAPKLPGKSGEADEADEQHQAGFSTAYGAAKEDSQVLRWTTWDHLVKLAEGCGINSEELVEVARFLYDAGTLVHFDDAFSGLQDLVVIDPQWLADVMKSIISFNNKWVKNGAITQRELYNWAWRDYPANIRPALQRIFEKFQIIYHLRLDHMLQEEETTNGETEKEKEEEKEKEKIEKRFMVPSLLPEDPPEEVLNRAWPTNKGEDVVEYARIYELNDFIPIGLFARLIVRMMHIPGVRLLVAWRTGVVVEADMPSSSGRSDDKPATYQALVRQLDKPEYKIEVLVRATGGAHSGGDGDGSKRKSVDEGVKLDKGKDKKKQQEQGEDATTDERGKEKNSYKSTEQKLFSSVLQGVDKTTETRYKDRGGEKVFLLEQVIYLIDVLLQGYTGLEVSRKIPCILPFPDTPERRCSHLFTYADCVESVMLGRRVECPIHGTSISVHRLAPDLAIGSVRFIEDSDLRKGNQIGQGGYGLVYKASWNNTPVALKLLIVKHEDEEELEEREKQSTKHYDEFKHEAFLMSCLEHENVIRLYGICYNPLGMVMEFAGNGDLHDLLESLQKGKVNKDPYSLQSGKYRLLPLKAGDSVIILGKKKKTDLYEVETMYGEKGLFPSELIDLGKAPRKDEQIPWALRWRIALDVAKGMNYLHSFQPPIVHRDLRSPNVFLTAFEADAKTVAKVGDFGLARHVDPRLHEGLPTWQWLAPEILDHENTEYDERSDIYSFGIVMYEIASRKLPYTEEYWDRFQRNGHFQAKDCQNAIVKDQCRPTPPADCPPEFSKLMQACWAHNPHDRPSFTQVVKTISAYIDSSAQPQL